MAGFRDVVRGFGALWRGALVAGLALSAGVGCGSETTAETDPGPEDEALTRPEGVVLCSSELSAGHAASKAFREALASADKEARAGVIEELEVAAEEHPEEAELALLLGLAHLWRIAEPLEGDQAVFISSALGAREELARAYELCPTDHRIPAWLGPVLVNMGRALNQQATVDEGLAVLQKGIDHYPSFVLFSKVLVYANEPAGSADFENAVEAVSENVDYCQGEDGELVKDPACNNGPLVPHNIEGSSVFLGDVFAKAGRKADALAFYEGAKTSEEYASWDWQGLLTERLGTLDARVAAFATPEVEDDPESAWTATYQCGICHSR